MKQTVTRFDFRDAFIKMNRGSNFSYAGINALFDYLTDLEEDTGIEQELDVVSLCCDYTEYDDIKAFWRDYDEEDYPTIEAIENETIVIRIDDDSFIVQAF